MKNNFEKKNWINLVSLRYFKARKKNKFVNLTTKISTFAISFSIAMLIMALAVTRGFEQSIFNKVLNDQGHIIIFGNGSFCADKIIKNIPKDFKYKQIIETYGILNGGFRTEMIILRGVEMNEINLLKPYINKFDDKFTSKSMDKSVDNYEKSQDSQQHRTIPKAYIGYKFAKIMGIKQGDILNIMIPVKASLPFGVVPENSMVKVEKIIKFNMHDLNRFGLFLEISDAKKLLNIDNNITKLLLYPTNKNNKTEQNILKVAQNLRQKFPSYHIFTWHDLNLMFADIMRIQKNMVAVILFAIIILAITALISSLVLFIYTKKREISILMILGATRKNIITIFMKTAALITLTSTIIGTMLGLALTYNLEHIRKFIEYIIKKPIFDPDIYLLPSIPINIQINDIVAIIGINFVISMLASFFATYQSTKVNLLESL